LNLSLCYIYVTRVFVNAFELCIFVAEVDDEDDEDEEEAEDGYDDIVERDKGYIREDGPSARDIEDRMRRKGLWE